MDSNVMPCHAAQPLLADYLAGELTPSERLLLQAHLARCPHCRAELESQAALLGRLRSALAARTGALAPRPQAADRLLARLPLRRPAPMLAGGAGRAKSLKPTGGFIMNTRAIVGGLVALALTVSTAVAASPARAKVGAVLQSGWNATVETITGDSRVDVSADAAVTALFPTYLPAGAAWHADVQTNTDTELALKFSRGQEFVVLTLAPLSAAADVNADQFVTINGQPAGLQAGLQGSLDADFQEALSAWINSMRGQAEASAEAGAAIQYTDGRLLTWTTADAQAQLLSNLSLDEMLKVAQSLRAAADFNGDLTLALPQFNGATAVEGETETEAQAETEGGTAGNAEGNGAAETSLDVEATVDAAVNTVGDVTVDLGDDLLMDTDANADADADATVDVNGEGLLGLP